MSISIDNPKLRNDEQYVSHLVRNSRSRRGKLLSGDKYFDPQTIGLVWVDAGGRLFTINGTQVADTSIVWNGLFDEASTWIIDFTVSSYIAGSVTVGNTEDASAAITANGNYSIELSNYEDFTLSLTANSTFNGAVTINTVKRVS